RVEGRAPRPCGFPATELVDQDDAIPELGQVLERQQIVVGGPRPSVQAQDGPFRRPSVRAIEQIEAENLDVALGGFHAADARRGIRASTDDCLVGTINQTSTRSLRGEAVLVRQRFARGVEVIPERIQSKRDVREAEIADRHGEGRVLDFDPLHARNGWDFLHAVVVEQGLEDGDGPFHSGVERHIDESVRGCGGAYSVYRYGSSWPSASCRRSPTLCRGPRASRSS